jgi:hypothetical protein
VDPNAIQTQAFTIVLTQVALNQAQTAAAIPPTALPTETPFPTPTLSEIPTFPPPVGSVNTPFVLSPIPGFTPLATAALPSVPAAVGTITTKNGCNDGFYVDETKPFDGAQMKPGEAFNKGWTIKNTGTCPWDDGYSFAVSTAYSIGIDLLQGESTSITIKKSEDFIKPGMSQLFLLKLRAPKVPGKYTWCWKLLDDTGNPFGPLVSVVFEVVK